MKVLGGKLRGRLLKAPKSEATRPTTSLVRKALFDILQPHIHDSVFLDLFAGSGAMGIEALSRGAKEAIFVDSQPQAIRCIHDNLTTLDLSALVIQSDIFKALTKFAKQNRLFDIIYADPPYSHSRLYRELLSWIDNSSILATHGFLFLESPTDLSLEDTALKHLKPLPSREYGATRLTQYVQI